MKKSLPLTGYWLAGAWIPDRRIADPRPIACRTEFTVHEPAKLFLRISSCEYYALFINGEYVGHGPARSFDGTKAYDSVDISSFIHSGVNALALLVTMPTGEISHRGRFGWWCDCHDADGSVIMQTEKNSWVCRIAQWYGNFCEPRSLSSGRQEHISAEKEEKDWKILPLQQLSEAWHKPFVLGPVTWTPPWRTMRLRGTAMQERVDLPQVLAGYYTASAEIFPVETLADSFNALTFQKGGKTVFDGKLRAGEIYTFDLGKTRTFIPRIKVLRGNRNIRLEGFCDIRHFDRPQVTSPLESAGAGFADTCLLSDDNGQEFIPIVPYGGRFWSLRAAGSGECEISLQLQSLEYPYEKRNFFRSADKDLEKFMAIADATVRSATQEVFVDTCWREQALWTRDAAVSGPASFYLFGDLAVWKESLRLIGENISADGIPAAVVPAGVSHLVLVDQTFCWINSLEQYFMISGDENFIREMHLPVMNFLRLMRQFTTEQGLFAPPLWSWHFIDWAEVDLRPWSLAINAMLYSALISAERLSGSSENDGKFLSEFRELSQCGLSYFWDEEKGYYRNHLDGAAPELIETVFFRSENNCPNALPVHGNALLLAHGLFPEKYRCAAAGKLAKWLLPADQSIAKFGTSWFTIITKALFENGQSSAAWELLYERYGSAIKENSRTFGEKFPFGQFNSAHGWSTGIAEILFSTVWGIKIIAPGFRKISIAPVKALPDGEVKLHTPGGVVHLAAENGSVTVLDCTMPFLRLDP